MDTRFEELLIYAAMTVATVLLMLATIAA